MSRCSSDPRHPEELQHLGGGCDSATAAGSNAPTYLAGLRCGDRAHHRDSAASCDGSRSAENGAAAESGTVASAVTNGDHARAPRNRNATSAASNRIEVVPIAAKWMPETNDSCTETRNAFPAAAGSSPAKAVAAPRDSEATST